MTGQGGEGGPLHWHRRSQTDATGHCMGQGVGPVEVGRRMAGTVLRNGPANGWRIARGMKSFESGPWSLIHVAFSRTARRSVPARGPPRRLGGEWARLAGTVLRNGPANERRMARRMKSFESGPWSLIHVAFSRTARNAGRALASSHQSRSSIRMAGGNSVPACGSPGGRPVSARPGKLPRSLSRRPSATGGSCRSGTRPRKSAGNSATSDRNARRSGA